MSFFRRKNPNASVIPPVAPPESSGPMAPADTGAARTQLFSRGGGAPSLDMRKNAQDPYAPALDRAPSYRTTDNSGGDPYGDNKANEQRGELFGGFQPKDEIPKDRKYGYEGREMEDDFDENEEIEGIKQEMKGLKLESLSGTR